MPARHRVLWVLAGLLLLGGAAIALPRVLSRPQAGHLVASVVAVDFGSIPSGEVDSMTFTLRNEGSRTVTIGIIGANCSCFRVDQSYAHRLDPGEETDVHLSIHTEGVSPEPLQNKVLKIPSDDPAVPLLEIPIQGDILPLVRIMPGVVEFGRVAPGATPPPTRKVEVRPGAGYRMKVLRTLLSQPEVFTLASTEAAGGVDLTVGVHPAAKGTGVFRGALRIEAEITGDRVDRRNQVFVVDLQGEWK